VQLRRSISSYNSDGTERTDTILDGVLKRARKRSCIAMQKSSTALKLKAWTAY
jgi:hypothetical protein